MTPRPRMPEAAAVESVSAKVNIYLKIYRIASDHRARFGIRFSAVVECESRVANSQTRLDTSKPGNLQRPFRREERLE